GKDGAKPEGAEPQKDKPQGAPEKYQDFKLPEGMKLEAAAMDQFTALAKKMNLSQEAAQEGLDFYTKIVAQDREASIRSFDELKASWLEESKKAFGSTFESDLAVASKAIERFGPPDLKKVLNESGLGNHPAILRWAHAVGKSISEDKFVEGAGRETPKSDAELFYGDSMKTTKPRN
ncbi:MAG: hypothetical protein HY079_06345, partial [Elusimicrobia bacterium]|nr:hypothetical protein [Elusimicrobiota bacterium]